IAITNKDLPAETAQGRFRKDLYYRLNVLHVGMPPIRDRRSEVPLFIEHFLRPLGKRMSPEAVRKMGEFHWPGNVREIKNLVKRLAVMRPEEEIALEHLPREIREGGPGAREGVLPLREALDAAEKRHLLETLEAAGWNQTRAAAILRIDRKTLRIKMKAHGLRPPAGISVEVQ
ncbi:MAG: sigma-54-dependent Fis family transcriptional regulator, partial [Nitrospirae bacterium]|nr:sigma-54-dependent Fis family transcriptional regulator [Nitrospirota bacterium]